jgi:hypothetical protein
MFTNQCNLKTVAVRALPIISTLIVIASGTSCNSPAVSSTATESTGPVISTISPGSSGQINSIDLNIKKVIPTAGITFWLKPQDANLAIVETTGVADIALYFQEKIDIDGIVKKGALIQEWSDIPIAQENYSPYLGAAVGIEYNDNIKILASYNIYGVLVVTLRLPDGTLMTAEETYVPISEEYACCGG